MPVWVRVPPPAPLIETNILILIVNAAIGTSSMPIGGPAWRQKPSISSRRQRVHDPTRTGWLIPPLPWLTSVMGPWLSSAHKSSDFSAVWANHTRNEALVLVLGRYHRSKRYQRRSEIPVSRSLRPSLGWGFEGIFPNRDDASVRGQRAGRHIMPGPSAAPDCLSFTRSRTQAFGNKSAIGIIGGHVPVGTSLRQRRQARPASPSTG